MNTVVNLLVGDMESAAGWMFSQLDKNKDKKVTSKEYGKMSKWGNGKQYKVRHTQYSTSYGSRIYKKY